MDRKNGRRVLQRIFVSLDSGLDNHATRGGATLCGSPTWVTVTPELFRFIFPAENKSISSVAFDSPKPVGRHSRGGLDQQCHWVPCVTVKETDHE